MFRPLDQIHALVPPRACPLSDYIVCDGMGMHRQYSVPAAICGLPFYLTQMHPLRLIIDQTRLDTIGRRHHPFLFILLWRIADVGGRRRTLGLCHRGLRTAVPAHVMKRIFILPCMLCLPFLLIPFLFRTNLGSTMSTYVQAVRLSGLPPCLAQNGDPLSDR